MTRRSDDSPRYGLWAALLILAGTLGRVWFVASGQLNLVQDEAQYWDWTRHLQLTYYSKGPLIAWIISFWTALFGNTELGVRFGSIAGAALAQGVLYLGAARLWKRPDVGFWTVVLMNTMPLFLALGVLMTTDNPFVLCWAVGLFCLWAAGEGRGGPWPYTILTLALGVGILAKYTMLGFLGLAVLYGLILEWKGWRPERFWRRLIPALAGALVLGFLPTFIWNVQNDFVGYKHVLYLIGVEGKESGRLLRLDRFPEYFGSQVGLATPWWLWFMLAASWSAAKRLLAAPRGLAGDDAAATRRSSLLLVFFLPVWGFFLLWSFHAKVLPNWTTVSYVAGALLAAWRFADLVRDPARRVARNALLVCSFLIFLALHLAPVLPIPDSVNMTNRLKGWESVGQKVDELRRGLPDPDKTFIFSDVYDVTAALAFYVPGQPRTYCAWIDGRRMNQYDLWPGPQAYKGGDAILVIKGTSDSIPRKIVPLFESVSDPIHFQSEFRGKPARRFTLYVCKGYKGDWYTQQTGFF
ncbi:ArnT family glycosyltransferase [Desulfovibrio aminophilus]|uniref:ArnT family glycosyltransferase n=1 Tax=Desulfovibrio aminophilus TaxID=81425 RepID=UPI00041C2CAF|nr:glycosyltransferase family 39 protein [Desulfovibrio aminophilus]